MLFSQLWSNLDVIVSNGGLRISPDIVIIGHLLALLLKKAYMSMIIIMSMITI